MTDQTPTTPPVFADTLTGFRYNTAGNVSPIFAAGWRSLMGTIETPDPGRVFARPTARHQQGYEFNIRCYVRNDAKHNMPADVVDAAGNPWAVDVSASRYDGHRIVDLDYKIRGAVRAIVVERLAAWLATPEGTAERELAAIADARRDVEHAAYRVEHAAAALAAARTELADAHAALAAAQAAVTQ